MGKTRLEQLSVFLSLILRHNPSAIGIELDSHGYADVKELLQGMEKANKHLAFAELKEIVHTDKKQRYSFDAEETKIRANQGHSIPVDLELAPKEPPEVLYHGTATRFLKSIREQGILAGSRQYVHLSKDQKTAFDVGLRHGIPVILVIDAKRMHTEGIPFYLSENNVWLTKQVGFQYVKETIKTK